MLHLFNLRRWQTYAYLALASTTCLVSVWLRLHSDHHHVRLQVKHASLRAMPPELLEPAPRAGEPRWVQRHEGIVAKAASAPYDVLLLGDSITQGWEYQSQAWRDVLPEGRALNAGIASDRVENILWRVQHGLFAKNRPKVVVLMAGINNLALLPPQQIAGGVAQIVAEIRSRAPGTDILVLGLLPSGEEATHPRREKIRQVNAILAGLAKQSRVHYFDPGWLFLTPSGELTKAVSFDGVHLTRAGYSIWAHALHDPLNGLLTGISH